jgi:hypothetical protein
MICSRATFTFYLTHYTIYCNNSCSLNIWYCSWTLTAAITAVLWISYIAAEHWQLHTLYDWNQWQLLWPIRHGRLWPLYWWELIKVCCRCFGTSKTETSFVYPWSQITEGNWILESVSLTTTASLTNQETEVVNSSSKEYKMRFLVDCIAFQHR